MNAGQVPAGAAGTDVLAPSQGQPPPIPASVARRIEAALAGEAADRQANQGVRSRAS